MDIKRHDSIRGEFAYQLHQQMEKDSNIWLVMGDLGYAMLDFCRRDFPDRCINVGAAEQAMLGVSVGLSEAGKRVFTYTITSFYLRAAETIGLYLHNEGIPVQLVGSGRDRDYAHDGPSHHGMLSQAFLGSLNLEQYYPDSKEEISEMVEKMVVSPRPGFISLKR